MPTENFYLYFKISNKEQSLCCIDLDIMKDMLNNLVMLNSKILLNYLIIKSDIYIYIYILHMIV